MLYLWNNFQLKASAWMCLREVSTLLVDYSHNMDHKQMICLKLQIHKLYCCMNLQWKFKEIMTRHFFKFTFIMYQYKCCTQVMLTKSSDILNKNTLGVKKVRGQAEVALWVSLHVTKIFDINWGQEIIYQKSFQLLEQHTIVYRVFSQLWLALSLGHLYNSDVVQKRWPSDKANHSCENTL